MNNLNMYADWFDRCCGGTWVSHRRYLMGPKKKIDNLVTEFSTESVGTVSMLFFGIVTVMKVRWVSVLMGIPL